MNYIKMSLYSFAKNKLTFIFIIIETGALFLALNFLVSTLYDIDVLNRAYKDILAENILYLMKTMLKILCLTVWIQGSRAKRYLKI